MKDKVWIEEIGGVKWRVRRVTGPIARMLCGRNSYLAYNRISPLPGVAKEKEGRQ